MTKSEYTEALEKNFAEGLAIMLRKNADYAHGDDPFKNFKSAPVVGVDVGKGILVRMLDKLTRVGNLIEKDLRGEDAAVKDEAVGDTLTDLMNYANILKVWLERGRSVSLRDATTCESLRQRTIASAGSI